MSCHTHRQTHILDRLLYLTTKVAGDKKFWVRKASLHLIASTTHGVALIGAKKTATVSLFPSASAGIASLHNWLRRSVATGLFGCFLAVYGDHAANALHHELEWTPIATAACRPLWAYTSDKPALIIQCTVPPHSASRGQPYYSYYSLNTGRPWCHQLLTGSAIGDCVVCWTRRDINTTQRGTAH